MAGFESIIAFVLEMIRSSGPWGVFIGVMIESVLAPIPSPVVIMAAGFIMLEPGVSFLQILVPLILTITIPGAVASTLGAFIGYGIGYYGGKPLIKKFEWLLGVSWDELDKGMKYFQKGAKDEAVVFLARAIPIIPLSVFSAVAGVLRLDTKKFTLFTFLGTLVRVFMLGILGWLFGSAYNEIALKIDSYEIIGIILIVAAVAGLFYYLWKKNKKSKKN